MPIYDFKCDVCGIETEKMVSIKESENVKCDNCGNIMKKMVSNNMTFNLVYDPKKHVCSWSSEGYATTQRYREMKK